MNKETFEHIRTEPVSKEIERLAKELLAAHYFANSSVDPDVILSANERLEKVEKKLENSPYIVDEDGQVIPIEMKMINLDKYINSDLDWVLQREYGKTPNGNSMNGKWVLRNKERQMLGFDQFRHDLAEFHRLNLIASIPF